MTVHMNSGARWLGIAATAALALGFATTGPAAAATASASVANDTLTVKGTRAADQIALRLAAGDLNTLQVDFGDDGSADQSFDRGTFSHIAVYLKRGADEFRIDESNGPIADEGLVVKAGRGHDTIVGSSGNDLIYGGRGPDTVSGARGNDTAALGAGRDSFTWLPGEGSDVIDGGGDADSLVFDGSSGNEVMSLSANGERSVFLRDLGTIRMDMDDVENLDLAALGGADTVTIDDMSGTDFRNANIDLSAEGAGDGAADTVTANGSARSDRIRVTAAGAQVDVDGFSVRTHVTGSETTDRLQLNGRGGNDTLKVGRHVATLIGVTADLGAGQI
jgi:Ca2+-binding RTX toxin-like protein